MSEGEERRLAWYPVGVVEGCSFSNTFQQIFKNTFKIIQYLRVWVAKNFDAQFIQSLGPGFVVLLLLSMCIAVYLDSKHQC